MYNEWNTTNFIHATRFAKTESNTGLGAGFTRKLCDIAFNIK